MRHSLARLGAIKRRMAPQSRPATSALPLRVIMQRLTATPTSQLPHTVPVLAYHLEECAHILTSTEINTKSEHAVLVHKFKTQISAWLHDKAPERRYAAVVLVRAAVEIEGLKILQDAGLWVRSLLGILGVSPQINMQ